MPVFILTPAQQCFLQKSTDLYVWCVLNTSGNQRCKRSEKRQISHRFPGNSDEGRHDTMTSFCQRKRNINCEQHLVIMDRVRFLCREICMKRVTHVYDTQVCTIYKWAQWFVCNLWVHTNVCFNSHTKKNQTILQMCPFKLDAHI